MSNVPRARELVAQAAKMLPVGSAARATLMAALPLLTRESPVKRTGKKSRMMTQAVACEIWRYYRRNKDASHQDIGDALRVNPRRVSEVLNGLRYPEAATLSLKENTR
jgi:hypothetical protein